jgi:hypothetical protein
MWYSLFVEYAGRVGKLATGKPTRGCDLGCISKRSAGDYRRVCLSSGSLSAIFSWFFIDARFTEIASRWNGDHENSPKARVDAPHMGPHEGRIEAWSGRAASTPTVGIGATSDVQKRHTRSADVCKSCLRAPYLALSSSAVGLVRGRCFHSNSAPLALESCERRGSNCSWRVHTGLASHVALAQQSALCEGIWFELTLGLRSKQEARRMLLDRSALPTSPPIGPSSVLVVQLFS